MSIVRVAAAAVLLAGVTCAHAVPSPQIRLVEQDSGVDVRLRGISAVSARVAWASGGEGAVLRTLDGGDHWQRVEVPGASELDFRDVEGFDADRAVVLSIGPGEASRVYRTDDGGRSWALTLQNREPAAFLDCMAFEGEHGVILGDPVDGQFQIHETTDGGRHWVLRTDGPPAVADEAAFAASGTCIALDEGRVVVATGGARARLHTPGGQGAGDDAARPWQATPAADAVPAPSTGYFSIAPVAGGFIAVGGDYQQPDADGLAVVLPLGPADGAGPGALGYDPQPAPAGYRSGIACLVKTDTCIATGPSGTDRWGGERWATASLLGFDAIDLAGTVGWLSGEAGRIARIEIDPLPDGKAP